MNPEPRPKQRVFAPSLEIPDQVQLNSLAATEGALSAYGPGAKPLITLTAWREQFRVQQVAFRLARDVVRRWQGAQTQQTRSDAAWLWFCDLDLRGVDSAGPGSQRYGYGGCGQLCRRRRRRRVGGTTSALFRASLLPIASPILDYTKKNGLGSHPKPLFYWSRREDSNPRPADYKT